MMETISCDVRGGIWPGHRTIAAVWIEPSLASPSSPRYGPETYVGHVPPNSRTTAPWGGVVGREHDDRVAFEVQLSQRIEHRPHDRIPLHQGVAELADARLPLEAFRRQVRIVRPGDRQIEEERFAPCFLALDNQSMSRRTSAV